VESDLIFIEKWIQKNAESKNISDRPLRWTDLFKKLEKFNIKVEADESNQKFLYPNKHIKSFFL